MNYIRKINQKFIDDLLQGELKELLPVVKSDSELNLEIRKGYINIYYLGGNLLKITQKVKGYKFEFNKNYCIDEKDKTIIPTIQNIPLLKLIMQKWHNSKIDKAERKVQQYFCRDNIKKDSKYFVVDMEYQTGKNNRIDMLALTRTNDEIKIALIELKQGYKSIANGSGLLKHYIDFAHLIKNNSHDITETIKNIYLNKVALGLIPDCFNLEQINGFKILFVLYDYNDKSVQLNRSIKKINKIKSVPFEIVKVPKGVYEI